MAEDHRRVQAESVREVLLDDPSFLLEIVERVHQEILEAEMAHHIGAAPYERTERRRPPQRPQVKYATHQG
jgi:transposase-like protein